MTQVRVGLLGLLLVIVTAGSAAAQTPPERWQVSVDFLIIATRGNDVHVGDVFTETLRFTGTAADSRLDYGVEYEPIVPRMKSDQSVLISVLHRAGRWGVGARGWRVATDGSVDGRESTAVPTASFTSLTGIRLWDQSLLPVSNLQDPSGISPVGYDASNSLETFRVEGFAERRWAAGDDLNIATRFGLAYARVDNTRGEGQTMNTFLRETIGATTTTTLNDIVIRAESDASARLAGPLVALAGDSMFRRVRVDWSLSQALLMGTADTSGEWTDVDDITETAVTGGVTTVTATLLNGSIPMTREERVFVPTLDLQVKASVRATRQVSVGVGYFSSTWFNLPVAPAFSVPGEWTDLSGTGWRDQTRDVTFGAFSVFAALDF